MNLKIRLLFLVAITTSTAFVNYKNYKIYKIIPESEERVHILNDLRKDGHYDFRTDIINVGKHTKIIVEPSEHEEFEKYISNIRMKPELRLSNVQELILAQIQTVSTSKSNTLGCFDWNQYHTLDQIHNTCADEVYDLSKSVDLNSNFNFVWVSTSASKDPGSQSFSGPSAASEPKTKAIVNHVLNLKRSGRVIYYFALHSIIPFSHRSSYEMLEVPNHGDLHEIVIRGAEKLKEKHIRHYEVRTSADISYEEFGASFDWVKGVVIEPLFLLLELRDVGEYSFLLRPEQNITNNEEIMAPLVEINIATKELRHYSGTSSAYRSLIFMAVNAVLLVVVQ